MTLAELMPEMLRHEGVWEGHYRHVDMNGDLVDAHKARVECVFPKDGPYAYVQHNHFIWEDGRDYKVTLNGELRGDKIWWDNDNFSGWGWETDFGMVLLNLDRKDDEGANFYEMITIGDNGKHRARTWHWFKDGQLFKRTLCDEIKVS